MSKSLSHHHYYQILHPVFASRFSSKSSDSLTNINIKNDLKQKQKQVNKTTKMKKSQTIFSDIDTLTSTSSLRRRFSLFRLKRSQPSTENSHIQTLQQTVEQLQRDLQIKTDELETMKEHIETKQSNQSIDEAIQLQTILNAKLEEMLIENDFLKKSIQELESYAQQEKSKREQREKNV